MRTGLYTIHPVPLRRALAVVTNEGRVAVDADVPKTNGADAYGKDVWSWRPEVGVDGGNSTWLTGESAL